MLKTVTEVNPFLFVRHKSFTSTPMQFQAYLHRLVSSFAVGGETLKRYFKIMYSPMVTPAMIAPSFKLSIISFLLVCFTHLYYTVERRCSSSYKFSDLL